MWRRSGVNWRTRKKLKPQAQVRSIFFGGGTPSLMKPETVGAIIAAIADTWPLERDAEITLEANPTSVEAGRFRGYRAAGVNRVSLGVQAMNDADLRALGRLHSAEEAMAAVKIARDHFERYSFDLIYARPGQTPAQWRAELTKPCAMRATTSRSTSSRLNRRHGSKSSTGRASSRCPMPIQAARCGT